MDNSKSSEMMREILLKVLIGDELGFSMTSALLQFGLIHPSGNGKNKTYVLTTKGLARLQGE